MIQVKKVDILSLEKNSFNKLFSQSATASFFQSFQWLSLWNKHFGNGNLSYEVLNNEELIGIVPLYVNHYDKKINFLGVSPVLGKELVTDYGDIITLPNQEKVVWEAVIGKLKDNYKEWELELNFVRDSSPSYLILKGLALHEQGIDAAPYLDLPKTWEDYLNLLSHKDRHELRRKIRREENNSVTHYYPEIISQEDIEEFLRLMPLSDLEKQSFLSEEMKNFFRDIFNSLDPKNIILGFSKLNNINIAAVLAYRFEKKIFLYNSGFDPKYQTLSPGLLLKANLIKKAIIEGITKFDFLRGKEQYKYLLGAKDQKLFKFTIYL